MIALHDYLDYYAKITPTHIFSNFEGRSTTYGDAAALSTGIAELLTAKGFTSGDRIAILSRNSDRFLPIICAASKTGIIAVPLNYRLAGSEISFILEDAGVKLLFIQASELNGLKAKGWAAPDGCIIMLIEDLAAHSTNGVIAQSSTSDDALILQMYTSGTSGRPKGVLITQGALLANAHQLEVAIPYRLNRCDRYLIVCPLYHAAALISAVMTLRAGGEAVIHAEFDPVAVVSSLSAGGIAATTLIPAMISRCIEWAENSEPSPSTPFCFPALKHLLYGASPISPDILANAVAFFGCQFTQAFGLTETTSAATALTSEDHSLALAEQPQLLRSCGRALIGTRIHAGAQGANEVAEIQVSGPQLMQGYANLPEATAASLSGGWLKTGDAGTCDANGYLTISDRLKDMIISGGENIYSIEVENTLLSYPPIIDAAVIGVPDPEYGEALLAFIVIKGETVKTDAIIAHCRQLLAGYKIPRRYMVIEALPRNPSGKILKEQLREPFWKD